MNSKLVFALVFLALFVPITSVAQTSGPTTMDNTQGGIIIIVMLGISLGFLIYIKVISYPVDIICTNCNHRFKRNIKKGVSFENATRKKRCPKCHNTGYLARYSDYKGSRY